MAILIVDDENQTRTALRELLGQMGHKTILEAKNGEEALRVAEREKARLRLIVADWEMPVMDGITLLGKVAERPELDLAPFLLITSDLPKAELQALQKKTSRLDHFLIKPFRLTALEQAINAAQAHRAAARDTLILYGAGLTTLAEALRADGATSKSWRTVVAVADLPALEAALAQHARTLGALAVQPDAAIAPWLATFSKSPLGAATPILCASRDPQRIFPVRTYGQRYLDWAAGASPAAWIETLAALRRRAAHGVELELAFQELKAHQQARKTEAARRQVEAILKLDPASTEAHATLAELLEAAGPAQAADAAIEYGRAIEIHPCQPKPHIKLLNLLALRPRDAKPPLRDAAERAMQYCPQSQDVLLAAARAFEAHGDAEGRGAAAERILALNPKHPEALRILGRGPAPGPSS